MSIWKTHIPEPCSYQVSTSSGAVNAGLPCIFMGVWPTTSGTMQIKDGDAIVGSVLTLTASAVIFPFGNCGMIFTSLSISASAAVGTILFKGA